MRKSKRTQSAKKSSIVVTVARFGEDPVNVTLPKGSTVEDVLEEAEVEVTGREELFIDGSPAEDDDIVENADILSIVTPKQAGTH